MVFSFGPDAFKDRINDETRAQVEYEMIDIFQKERTGGDLSRIQFRILPSDTSIMEKDCRTMLRFRARK